MSTDLYQDAIMALARAETGKGTLEAADARVTVDNPLCGDRLTLEIKAEDGTVTALAHKVRGCALCRASASAIGEGAPGRPLAELGALEGLVEKVLADANAAPPEGWERLSAFAPVRAHKSRHDCVLLPFRALAEAVRSLS